MIVVDTSVIYALLDRRDTRHEPTVSWYRQARPVFATTPLVVAEVDHLAGARLGPAAVEAWRADLTAGAYLIEWWATAPDDLVSVAARYPELGIGLTDASLVVLAARLDTIHIATWDERHFRVVRPLAHGDAFRLLPTDG